MFDFEEKWVLARYSDKTFKIINTTVSIPNSYQKCRISVDDVKYILGGKKPKEIETVISDEQQYERAKEVMFRVNKDNLEERIPSKRVRTDRPGTSKLLLSQDRLKITICRRKLHKDGSAEEYTKSPGVCYIDNATREKFFRDVKSTVGPVSSRFGTEYSLYSYQGKIFDDWKNYMLKEYLRLCGGNQ